MSEKLIYELSEPGRPGVPLPELDVPLTAALPEELLRSEDAPLPEAGEQEVVRHFTRLSVLNHHVDKDFYPLGSCTMKYNPKINEVLAGLPEFSEFILCPDLVGTGRAGVDVGVGGVPEGNYRVRCGHPAASCRCEWRTDRVDADEGFS